MRIKVQVASGAKKQSSADATKVYRERDFIALPEFKGPLPQQKGPAAVADSSAAGKTPAAAAGSRTSHKTPAAVAGSSDPDGNIEWKWGQGRSETMRPFWAARRIAAQQLEKEVEDKPNHEKLAGSPSFPTSIARSRSMRISL